METYKERSLRIKYRSQGVQTSFYESTPSPSNPLGDQISPGTRGNSRHTGTNHPHASKERDNRGASEFPRILLAISRRLVNSPPGPPSSTLTSGSAHKYAAEPSRLYPKQKEIRAGPDSGSPVSRNPFTSGLRGSFPSRVQSLGDSCTCTPSILPPSTNLFSSVPTYGVTQLGNRSYQSGSFLPETSHFHSLGLTNRFTPPRRSEPLVLANLL